MGLVYEKSVPPEQRKEVKGEELYIDAMSAVKRMEANYNKDAGERDPMEVDTFLLLARALAEIEDLDVTIHEEDGWLRVKYRQEEMLLSRMGKEFLARLLLQAEDAAVFADREGKISLNLFYRTRLDRPMTEN